MARAANLTVGLSADDRRLARDLARSKRRWRRYRREVAAQAKAAASAVATAGVAGAAALAAMGAAALRNADDIAKQARNAGLAASDYQALAHAWRLAGSSQEALVKGSATLARSLYELERGTKTYVEAFARLNLTARDFEGLGLADSLRLVHQRLSENDDAAERLAVAQTVLGRAGKEMGSLMALSAGDLKALEDEARKLGLVLSDEAAAKAEEFNDELERMRRALQVQATQGFLDALPATHDWGEAIVSAGNAVRNLAGDVTALSRALADNGAQILVVLAALVAFRKGGVKGLGLLGAAAGVELFTQGSSEADLLRNRIEAEQLAFDRDLAQGLAARANRRWERIRDLQQQLRELPPDAEKPVGGIFERNFRALLNRYRTAAAEAGSAAAVRTAGSAGAAAAGGTALPPLPPPIHIPGSPELDKYPLVRRLGELPGLAGLVEAAQDTPIGTPLKDAARDRIKTWDELLAQEFPLAAVDPALRESFRDAAWRSTGAFRSAVSDALVDSDFSDIGDNVLKAFQRSLADAAASELTDELFKPFVNGLLGSLGGALSGAFGSSAAGLFGGDWFFGLLSFDGGGRVPGPPGAPMPILAHGQETVRTPAQERLLARSGPERLTINFNVLGDRADEVLRAIRSHAREVAGIVNGENWARADA